MPGASGRATARIPDTGKRWRNSLVFLRMPVSPLLSSVWENASLRTMASAKLSLLPAYT